MSERCIKIVKSEAEKIFEESVRRMKCVDKDISRFPGPHGRKSAKKVDEKKRSSHNRTADCVDLHGLTLAQGLEKAEKAISKAGREGLEIEIITGTGKHSPGLHSPLYIGIEDFLQENSGRQGFQFTKNNGVFHICFKK